MTAFRGWAIDRDYIEAGRIGFGQTQEDAEAEHGFARVIDITTELKASEVQDPVRFRALDDDGEVYYGGAVTRDWVTDGELAYEIDRFVEADAGAIRTEFRAEDLPEAFVARHRECNAVSKDGKWVTVYG